MAESGDSDSQKFAQLITAILAARALNNHS
jgi:hypothetical protein